MKIILSLLILICCVTANAQKKHKITFIDEGCYVSGYYSGNANGTNFWYIKKDSTFINFFVHPMGHIQIVRIGRWEHLRDSVVRLQYQPLRSALLLNSKVDYHTETQGSLDSNYFQGSVKDFAGNPIANCFVVIDNEKEDFARSQRTSGLKAVAVNADGSFSFNSVRDKLVTNLGISSPGYYPLAVKISLNNNSHTFNIKVPLKDSANDVNLAPFDYRPVVYKYHPLKKKQAIHYKENELAISFVTKDKEFLLNMLEAFKKKQPYLVATIDELQYYLKR